MNGRRKTALPIEPDATRCSILVCDTPWELTQLIGETIGVFDSAEQIMLWMLLLILCVKINWVLLFGHMRVQAGTNCAVRADAVTYWIAAQLTTPVKIDQSMASVPQFIERKGVSSFCPFPSTSPITSLHLTLLISAAKKQLSAQIYMCS